MTAEATAPPRPRSALGLMFDPVFGALFWGKMFAVVAVWTHGIVAAIVMYDATHSALMVGMVGVVQFGPQLILSPISGKWADTGNPARQILLGRVLCVAGSGFAAVWLFADPDLKGMAIAIPVLIGSLARRIRLRRGRPGDAVDRAESHSRGRTLDRHGAQQHADDRRPHRRARDRCLPGRAPRFGLGIRRQRRAAPRVRDLPARGDLPVASRTSLRHRLPRPHRDQVRVAGPPTAARAGRGDDRRHRIGPVDHVDPVDGRRTRRRHASGRIVVRELRHRRGGGDGGAGDHGWPDGLGAGVVDRVGRSGRRVRSTDHRHDVPPWPWPDSRCRVWASAGR